MRYLRLGLGLFLVSVVFFATGCGSSGSKKKDYETVAVRFLFEADQREAGALIRLPTSGTTVRVQPKSLFTEYDVTKVDVVNNEFGPALMFQFTSDASRDLFRQTLTAQGRRIVTTVNGQPVGAIRIDRPISQGVILTYVELPPEDLIKLASDITRTSEDARKEIQKK
jgi:hypothetical protein